MAHAVSGRGLGIVGWDTCEFIVTDLERSRRFYTEQLLLPEAATLEPRHARERGERAVLFAAGKAQVVCVMPSDPDGRAGRWLRRHPDGVAVLGLRVRSVDEAWRRLNNSRAQRYINPWSYPVRTHTYEEWENEFRDAIKEAGLPLERDK